MSAAVLEISSRASQMRAQLRQGHLTPAAAACELQVDEATFRSYCAGRQPVPRYVLLALGHVVYLRSIA
jgi:hypothetical protein